jgi:hypothetical protein
MSATIDRAFRTGVSLAVLSFALFLTARVAAQDPPRGSDLLDQLRSKNAVAAQQLENDVRDAIAEAQRLAATDPTKAVERLKKALAQVEDDKALTVTRRDSLLRDLKERVRVIEVDSRRAADRNADRANKTAVANARQAEQDAEAAEQAKIREGLNQLRSLQREGRADEAARLGEDLARRYPASLAVQVAARTNAMVDRVNEGRRLQAEGERRRLLVYQDVDRSAMLPIGDIEFPKDWAEKTKMRKKNQTPLTAIERAILNALNAPISIDLKDAKFEEVMDYLEKASGQSISLDKTGLDQAMVTYETPVTVRAKGVAMRTVLRKVLSQLGLAYVVKDQQIQITSAEKAKTMLTTRTYDVSELVALADIRLPPVLNELQMAQNVAFLIQLIHQTVDPDSWQANDRGGMGVITFYPATMQLIIKQSAEVHYALGGGLLK